MKHLALALLTGIAFAAPAVAEPDRRAIAIDPAPPLPPAPVLAREALVGEWVTQFASSGGGPIVGVGLLRITLDSTPDGLDGVSPAAGIDGVQNGAVAQGPNDTLIWVGRWVGVSPERGAATGTFRLVFTDANTFTGTWSSDDGETVGAAWNGRRLH